MSLLARRYANALFLAAREQGAVAAVGKDLEVLHAALAAPSAKAVLLSPDLTANEREGLLQRMAQGRHPLIKGLLQTALHRRRLEMLPDLQPAFRELELEERGEVEGVAETARPLDTADLQQVTALAQKLAGKKVILRVEVRPELIGGIRLRLGNELYDGSVSNALAQLEQRLMQATI
jgi:F-type H+-transporting ATPase subunit delta